MQAADAGADRAADPGGVGRDVEIGVADGLRRRGHRELGEPVGLARGLPVHVLERVEVLHLAGDVRRALGHLDPLDARDPRPPGADVLPGLVDGVPARGDATEAGDDHPAPSVRSAHVPNPPSTASTCPVTNAASSETRNRTARATSSGVAEPPERGRPQDRLAGRLGQRVGELGRDVPGRHGVHADAAAAELLGERLREPDQARLRRRVVRLAGISVHADHGRHVHDRPAPPLQHRPRDRTAGEERRRPGSCR